MWPAEIAAQRKSTTCTSHFRRLWMKQGFAFSGSWSAAKSISCTHAYILHRYANQHMHIDSANHTILIFIARNGHAEIYSLCRPSPSLCYRKIVFNQIALLKLHYAQTTAVQAGRQHPVDIIDLLIASSASWELYCRQGRVL